SRSDPSSQLAFSSSTVSCERRVGAHTSSLQSIKEEPPVQCSGPGRPIRLPLLAMAIAFVIALATMTSARAEPPSVTAKRDEARAVLAQIQELDSRLGKAVEAYNA